MSETQALIEGLNIKRDEGMMSEFGFGEEQ